MTSWKTQVAGATLALLVSFSVNAQLASNPVFGTWKLNLAKSKFDPGPAPKSQTRTYEGTADGIKLTLRTVTANGEVVAGTTYKPDGKSYPYVGATNFDAVAPTPVSDLEAKSDLIRAGKVIGHFSRVLSPDHKTLTVHENLTTTTGATETDIEVYDRR